MELPSQFSKPALDPLPNLERFLDSPDRAVKRLSRLTQSRIENTRLRIAQMEATITDFERTTHELESWIQAEQNRTGIHDTTHFAYSTSAMAMTRRRDALKRSIGELKRQLSDARAMLE
jgi:flagellar FliJ protein